MKHSPAHRTTCHEFSKLPSLPWRSATNRSSSPWIGFDPELQADCSAAYRAFRLAMLVLFALFGAGSRMHAQSSGASESGSLEARLEAQERQIKELKAIVVRQAHLLESQQQAIDELREGERVILAAAHVPSPSAAEDKSEAIHLVVNRSHAPPQTIHPAKTNEAQYRLAASLPNYQANWTNAAYFFQSSSSRGGQNQNPTTPSISEPSSSADNPSRGVRSESNRSQVASDAAEAPKFPLQFRIGSSYLTPLGFMDFTAVWRNHDVGSGIQTNFASIPYGANSFQTHLKELRLSSQYSRIGFRVDSLVGESHVTAYMESDFLGVNPGNLNVNANSNTLRLRLFWADLKRKRWEVLAGQTWSLLTPNRTGMSPLPADIFFTQNVDANYQVGLVWTRAAELRFVSHLTDKVSLGLALDSPEQYMGGSAGAGQITLPAALASTYGGTQLNNGNSGVATPNHAPDVIAKFTYDPTSRFHAEVGGVIRSFKLYNPNTQKHSGVVGGGGSFNLRYDLMKGVSVVSNNFWSDGGGRYLFGQVPDLIVHADGAASLIHAGSTLDGLEYTRKGSLFYAYYGGIYAQRNVAKDLDGKPIGYGYVGSPSDQNRSIQEGTVGFSQNVWRNTQYGGLSVLGQYSYVARSPWFVNVGQPANAHVHMVFMTLRFSLPGAAPVLRK